MDGYLFSFDYQTLSDALLSIISIGVLILPFFLLIRFIKKASKQTEELKKAQIDYYRSHTNRDI